MQKLTPQKSSNVQQASMRQAVPNVLCQGTACNREAWPLGVGSLSSQRRTVTSEQGQATCQAAISSSGMENMSMGRQAERKRPARRRFGRGQNPGEVY
jgi:hypothetical protein